MTRRRNFIKTSALTAFGSSFVFFSPLAASGAPYGSSHVVKQPEDCETIFVRENTPISFHISAVSDGVQSVSICSEQLQPGGQIPVHKHMNADEYFYFLAGTGDIIAEDVVTPFKAGTTAVVLKDTWHSIKNTGSGIVQMLFGFSPAGFEDFFRQIGTPKGQPFKQKPREEFDAICKRFGMVFR